MPRRKNDSIPLSPKHGLNPSMDCCFYCGEVTGIALMGKLKNDEEAPKECCTSLEPCDKCKEKYKGYLLLVEIKEDKSGPTGRWSAIPKIYIDKSFQEYSWAPSLESQFTEITKGVEDNEKTN